jgi:hypothetical protein
MEALTFCIDAISNENSDAKDVLYLSIKKAVLAILTCFSTRLVVDLIHGHIKFLCSLVNGLLRQLIRDNQETFLHSLKHSYYVLASHELVCHLKTLHGRSIYETFIQFLLIIVKDSSKDMVAIFSDLNQLIIYDLKPIFELQNVIFICKFRMIINL